MATSTVKTRFMIISDTHNFDFNNPSGPFRLPLPKVDVVLHCGDLTRVGGASSYKKALEMMGAIDAGKKLVIAGNHDLDLDESYWLKNLSKDDEPQDHDRAIEVMNGPIAQEAGVTYLTEGTHTFTLNNGAQFTIYASSYTPEFCNWAFSYPRNEDRYNRPNQVAEGVTPIAENSIPTFPAIDIMMTHGPPKGILDECGMGNVGCENLLRAASHMKPRLYCFGHIHEGHGASLITWRKGKKELGKGAIESERVQMNAFPDPKNWPIQFGEETLMVNAAIMDVENVPTSAPWLVELDLPRAENGAGK